VNHYCTYFDRGFLAQGLALWRSLAKHDVDSVLWVLALDDFTADVLREVGGTWLRVVTLAEVEAGDAELAAAQANRTRVEYFFTLSPCWPRWLLEKYGSRAGMERITYVDADMFFFASPTEIFEAMDAAKASVLVTAHRFPPWLKRYERHGKFNVGLLSFRNDAAGRGCLDDWRGRCLAWCYDRLEDGKYADQKYLDAWPERLGAALLVLPKEGVNLAPWNWGEIDFGQRRWVDDGELVLFHFARFRPVNGGRRWVSGQLEYGVMPRKMRNAIYGPYVRALSAARDEIAARRAGFDFPERGAGAGGGRAGRTEWQDRAMRVVFGGTWLRVGDGLWNLRGGSGRWSGRVLAWAAGWRG
jgi:hypothetical protein